MPNFQPVGLMVPLTIWSTPLSTISDIFSVCKYLYTVIKAPLNLLFDKVNRFSSLDFTSQPVIQSLHQYCGFPLNSQVFSLPFWNVGPELDTAFEQWFYQCCTPRKTAPLFLLLIAFFIHPRITSAFLAATCFESSWSGRYLQRPHILFWVTAFLDKKSPVLQVWIAFYFPQSCIRWD